ncbi:hypothetical protein [Haloarcula salinisoli]|uniref:Uncharacterized protein n=1 Tax=Haloarcula salinisoli TaxID=2487746 RepID=A0A8J8CBQ4_9EURY|nr:hypothetical protein [Halomicroarcula salinisoli]MBX0287799.1 hypothetical protein [Halomicroarcula salinisoli]MBX0304723.1 hypothetical protein [Halomicroarcula salinisoli]
MTLYDAHCEEHKAVNGRHYLSFTIEGAADLPDEFELQPSPLEYERLKEHSTGAEDGVGQVPAMYDDGWAIDWDALETAAED